MDQDREHAELCAAITAHTIASYAGKQLKDGAHLAYGDFMPSMRSRMEAARRTATVENLRGFLHGLAKDKGLA